MRHPLRILSVEDDPKDADLIKNLLDTEGIVCDITRVENQADFLASLKQGETRPDSCGLQSAVVRRHFRIEACNRSPSGRAVHLCFRKARRRGGD